MIVLPKIVRVEEGETVATRRADAGIAPRIPPRSRRREIEQLDPLVADRGRQFAPAVGRAIVDHEYLMRGKALRELALDRYADMRGLVLNRHHNGEPRGCGALGHQSRVAARPPQRLGNYLNDTPAQPVVRV